MTIDDDNSDDDDSRTNGQEAANEAVAEIEVDSDLDGAVRYEDQSLATRLSFPMVAKKSVGTEIVSKPIKIQYGAQSMLAQLVAKCAVHVCCSQFVCKECEHKNGVTTFSNTTDWADILTITFM